VALGAKSVGFPAVAGDEVWWQESRPAEGGRVTIMASAGPRDEPRALLPGPWYAPHPGARVRRPVVPAGAVGD